MRHSEFTTNKVKIRKIHYSLNVFSFFLRQWIHHDRDLSGNLAWNWRFIEWLRGRADRRRSGWRRFRNSRFWWIYGDDDWRIKDLKPLLKRNPALEGDLVHSTWGLPSYPGGQKQRGRWIRALHSAWGAQTVTKKILNRAIFCNFFKTYRWVNRHFCTHLSSSRSILHWDNPH